ncbi:MAG: Ig-like domain-containing protein, partial [Lachnospiraceae bacterium]|nr:Ig-like domain-containing protein [Lachnospiraceae bacterium]
VGDTVIADYKLDYSGNDDLYSYYFDIPSDVLAANVKEISTTDASGNAKTETVVPVKFTSSDSSDSARLAGGLYMTVKYSNNASIVSVTSNEGTVVADGANYKIYVPTTSLKTKYKVNIADQYGLLYIDGVLVNDAKMQTGILTGDTTVINAKVYGEDHETNKDYTITIIKGEYVAPDDGTTAKPPISQNPQPKLTLAQAVEAFRQTKLPSSVTVYKGSTETLALTYTDTFNEAVKQGLVSVKSVTYKSAKKKIATVSSAGKIKGVKKGSSKITATITLSTGDVITLTTTAKVKNPEIKITGKKTVKKGKSITLKAKGYGVKGKVKWSVNKSKLAKITKKGKLTGLKKGKVKVTAKISKVKKTVTIKIK